MILYDLNPSAASLRGINPHTAPIVGRNRARWKRAHNLSLIPSMAQPGVYFVLPWDVWGPCGTTNPYYRVIAGFIYTDSPQGNNTS